MNFTPGVFGPGTWTTAILSPALMLGVIFAFVLAWRYLRYLERRDGTRGWMQAPPPAAQPTLGMAAQGVPDPRRQLRNAITWCAVGVALLLGALILRGGPVLLLAGLIVLLVGVVRLIFVLIERP